MSHKHVGPIGWEFSGDKTRCFQLIGPARVLVQQALDKIQARGGRGQQMEQKRLGDGSTIRVQVVWNFESPVVRACLYAPKSTLDIIPEQLILESGLLTWAFPLDTIEYPLSVEISGDLADYFSADQGPFIQGPLKFKLGSSGSVVHWSFSATAPTVTDGSYPSDIYTTREKHDTIVRPVGDTAMGSASADPRLSATRYSGWARLWIQAIAGSSVRLDTVLNGYPLTFDTGLLVSLNGDFWLCSAAPNGVFFTKLVLSPLGAAILAWVKARHPDITTSELPWTTDQETRLALSYVMVCLSVPDQPTVAVIPASTMAAAYADGHAPICAHGWQWNRKGTAAVLVTRALRDDGVYSSSILAQLTIGWSEDEPTVSMQATPSTWRLNPAYSLLWLPQGPVGYEVLALELPKPPYTGGSSHGTGYVHAFFSVDDTLEVLTCMSYQYTYASSKYTQEFPCYLPGQTKKDVSFEGYGFGSGGFNGNSSAYESWAKKTTWSYKTNTLRTYKTTIPYSYLYGSEAFTNNYCERYQYDPRCYGNAPAYGAITTYQDRTGKPFNAIMHVDGVTFNTVLDVVQEASGSISTKQALVISAYDPTVYFSMQIVDEYHSSQNISSSYGPGSNYGSFTGFDVETAEKVAEGSRCIGVHVAWHTNIGTGSSIVPASSRHEFTGSCYAGQQFHVIGEFGSFFEYDLMNPDSWYRPANDLFGHVSAGGVATYTYSDEAGKNNQGYEYAFPRYPTRALWVGGA